MKDPESLSVWGLLLLLSKSVGDRGQERRGQGDPEGSTKRDAVGVRAVSGYLCPLVPGMPCCLFLGVYDDPPLLFYFFSELFGYLVVLAILSSEGYRVCKVNVLRWKEHWIRDEGNWILGSAPCDSGHDISLCLSFPPLGNEHIHQMISNFHLQC